MKACPHAMPLTEYVGTGCRCGCGWEGDLSEMLACTLPGWVECTEELFCPQCRQSDDWEAD